MKKIAVILLLVIYGSSTMGATIHLHYCMNEFVGWSFWHSEGSNKCSKCGMKGKKEGCCKDEHKQVKLSTDQTQNSSKTFVFEQIFSQVFLPQSAIDIFSQPTTAALNLPKYYEPPFRWRNVPLYLSNCVFLI